MEKKVRIEYIDLVKGITMFLVIMFHLTFFHEGTTGIRRFITPFFMQLFFFLSGMFFSTKGSLKEFTMNRVNRLIIPMLFFYFLNYLAGFIVSTVLGMGGTNNVDVVEWSCLLDLFNGREYFTFAGAIWFLFCLLIINYVYYLIVAVIRSAYVRLTISFVLTVAGYLLSVYKINLPYFLDTSLSMLFFFSLGEVFRSNPLFKERKKSDYLWFAGTLAVFLLIVFVFNVSTEAMLNAFRGNFFMIVLGALIGSLAIFTLGKIINRVGFINYIGTNTLIVLCTHQALIVLFSMVLKKVLYRDGFTVLLINFVLIVLSEFVIIFLMNKLFPWFVGRKDLFPSKK